MNEATWIADLLAHGLLRSSFVPTADEPLIFQVQLTEQTGPPLSSRIQKILEDANLKLGSVLSDVPGKSGRAMLNAIIAGLPSMVPARVGKKPKSLRSDEV